MTFGAVSVLSNEEVASVVHCNAAWIFQSGLERWSTVSGGVSSPAPGNSKDESSPFVNSPDSTVTHVNDINVAFCVDGGEVGCPERGIDRAAPIATKR